MLETGILAERRLGANASHIRPDSAPSHEDTVNQHLNNCEIHGRDALHDFLRLCDNFRLRENAVLHDLQRHRRHVCIALQLPDWCAE